MRKFTQQQIIQYIYGEASPILKMAIGKALKDDLELQKEVLKLKAAQKKLDNLKKVANNPSQSTIDAILSYAKTTSTRKRK